MLSLLWQGMGSDGGVASRMGLDADGDGLYTGIVRVGRSCSTAGARSTRWSESLELIANSLLACLQPDINAGLVLWADASRVDWMVRWRWAAWRNCAVLVPRCGQREKLYFIEKMRGYPTSRWLAKTTLGLNKPRESPHDETITVAQVKGSVRNPQPCSAAMESS